MKIQNAKSIIFKRLAPSCIALIGGVLGVASSTSSHAALIQITTIDGITLGAPNGGLGNPGAAAITLGPGGGTATLRNNAYDQTGFMQTIYYPPFDNGFFAFPEQLALEFALSSNNYASPRQFTSGQTIDSSALWTYHDIESSEFKVESYPMSPDFGANTYMGFRSGGGEAGYNYGYLEVTWTASTETFTILGGAYESDYNVAIMAGATSAAVPEPGQVAASLLLLCGIGGYIFLKRRKVAKPVVAPIAA
jgi:hypothetical protein